MPSTVAAAKPGPHVAPPDDVPEAVSAITDASRSPAKKSRAPVVAVLGTAIVLAVCAAWAWFSAKQAPSSSDAAQQMELPAKVDAEKRPVAPPPARTTPQLPAAGAPEESPPPQAAQPAEPALDVNDAEHESEAKRNESAAKPRLHKPRVKESPAKQASGAAQAPASQPSPAPATPDPAAKPRNKPDALGIEGEWK